MIDLSYLSSENNLEFFYNRESKYLFPGNTMYASNVVENEMYPFLKQMDEEENREQVEEKKIFKEHINMESYQQEDWWALAIFTPVAIFAENLVAESIQENKIKVISGKITDQRIARLLNKMEAISQRLTETKDNQEEQQLKNSINHFKAIYNRKQEYQEGREV